jgi:hypothetical protein
MGMSSVTTLSTRNQKNPFTFSLTLVYLFWKLEHVDWWKNTHSAITFTSHTKSKTFVKSINYYQMQQWYLGLYLVTVIAEPLSDILWNTLPMLRKYSSVGSISRGRDITSELIMPAAAEVELLPGVCACFFELCSDKTINWNPWEAEW